MARGYQRTDPMREAEAIIDNTLEGMVREGARRMLAAALDEEVAAFLERDRYERGKPFRGYRNGHLPSRELTVGVSAVEVRVPRGEGRAGACGARRVPFPGRAPLRAGVGEHPGIVRTALS